mmetsp:Transcript_62612/g.175005  ORF Transcript_62612/g.175005 Transcript_62612/m.175005 type:complete len:248 (-) Transcript_62612:63-806(-)
MADEREDARRMAAMHRHVRLARALDARRVGRVRAVAAAAEATTHSAFAEELPAATHPEARVEALAVGGAHQRAAAVRVAVAEERRCPNDVHAVVHCGAGLSVPQVPRGRRGHWGGRWRHRGGDGLGLARIQGVVAAVADVHADDPAQRCADRLLVIQAVQEVRRWHARGMTLVLASRVLLADQAQHPGTKHEARRDLQDDGRDAGQLRQLRGHPSGAQKSGDGQHGQKTTGAAHCENAAERGPSVSD